MVARIRMSQRSAARQPRIDALLTAYRVAHQEKLFSSKIMMTRSSFFIALNGALLAAFPYVIALESKTLLPIACLLATVAAGIDLCWARSNSRNRAYTAYCVHHLGRIEAELSRLGVAKEFGNLFSAMPGFAKNEALTYRDPGGSDRTIKLDATLLRADDPGEGGLLAWLNRWLPAKPIEVMMIEIAFVLSVVWAGIGIGCVVLFFR